MDRPTVLFPLFDRVQSLDVTGPLEVFHGAASIPGHAHRAPRVVTASPDGAPVRTDSGLTLLPDTALDRVGAIDTLVVPGGPGTRTPDPRLVTWVAERAPHARRVASVCTGAFVLAEAGLLDGRRATTHWDHCATLARRFPDITVDPDPIFVRDGPITTSAGVTAGIDLALALVEDDLGADAALLIARHLVMFLRRPSGQAQFSTHLATRTARRPALRDLQHWIADNPAADLSVPALAERAGFSPRQFSRLFTAEVGTTPGRHVERVRLETARRLLEESDDGVTAIARACGLGTDEALRRAFVRSLGCTPTEYRNRFRTTT
ncbi:GlxA family transcriptional regulator [Nocardiopsis alba]|uniref:GlxA family transcriptional regulator n=1 Tax=Nocardiopsis alba TaxID=53437 RepID=UPI0033BFFB4B